MLIFYWPFHVGKRNVASVDEGSLKIVRQQEKGYKKKKKKKISTLNPCPSTLIKYIYKKFGCLNTHVRADTHI